MPYNLRSRSVQSTTLPSTTLRKTCKATSKTLSSNKKGKETEPADGCQTVVEKNIKSSNGEENSNVLRANRIKGQEDVRTSKEDKKPSYICDDKEISKQNEYDVCNWNLKVAKGYVIVEGITSNNNKRWHSGCIRKAVPPSTLISKSGSVYRLIGEPDKRLLNSLTKPDYFQYFTNGLPNNWQLYIAGLKHMSCGIRTRSTSTPSLAIQPPSTSLPRITTADVQPPPTSTPLPSSNKITVSSPIVSPLKCIPNAQPISSQQRTPPPLNQIKMCTPSINLTKASDLFVSSLKRSSSGRLIKPVLLNTTNGKCNYTYSVTGELLWVNGPQPSGSTTAHTPLAEEPAAKQKKNVQKKQIKVPRYCEEGSQQEGVGDSEGDQHQTGIGDTEEEEKGQKQAELLGLACSKSSSEAFSKDTVERPSVVNVSSTNAGTGKRRNRRKKKSLVFPPKRKVTNRETSGNRVTDQHCENTTGSQQYSEDMSWSQEEDTSVSKQHSMDTTGSQQHSVDTTGSQQHLEDTIKSQQCSNNSPKWNKNVITTLKRVVYSVPAMHEDFWEEVSRIMGADKYSAEECRNRYNCLKRESTKDKNTINKGVNTGLRKEITVGSRNSVTPQRDIFLHTQATSLRKKQQAMFRLPSDENVVYRSEYTVPPKRFKTSKSTPNSIKKSLKELTKIRDSRTGEERMFTLFSDEEEDDGSTSDEDRYYSILDLLSRSPLTGYRK